MLSWCHIIVVGSKHGKVKICKKLISHHAYETSHSNNYKGLINTQESRLSWFAYK